MSAHVRPLMEGQVERERGDAEAERGVHLEEAEDGQRVEVEVGQEVMECVGADDHDRERHDGEALEESVRSPWDPRSRPADS